MKWLIINLVLSSSTVFSAVNPKEKKFCLSAREYITTVRFLRDQKAFGLSEKEIQNTADTVSSGCTNSSKRFINTLKVLTKLGIDTRSAIKTALKFAGKTDQHSEAFVSVFKYSYNPDKLDLDPLTALKISLALSAEFDGNLENAVRNYQDIVEYCLENKSMELPLSQCAGLAKQVSINGKEFKKPLAPQFKSLAKFLQRDKRGPKLPVLESIKISKNIIMYGPTASENYIQAFKFATAKSGLKLSHQDALKFSKKMAKRSKLETKTK